MKYIFVVLMLLALPALADNPPVVVHEATGDRTIIVPSPPPTPELPPTMCTAHIQKVCYAECGGDPTGPMCNGGRPQ